MSTSSIPKRRMEPVSSAMKSTGGNAVSRTVTIFTVLVCFLGSVQAIGADSTRIRWVTSAYGDIDGRGLKHPESVACSGKDLFVADTGNSRLLHYTYEDKTITAKATFAIHKSVPIVVQVNSKGQLYYLDGRERRIVVLDTEGRDKFLAPKGLPFSTEMVPKSFKIDSEDKMYILDIFSENVVILDSGGQYLRHLAFPEGFGSFSDLAVDSSGSIFLLDGVEATIYSAGGDADQFSPLTESLKEYVNFPSSLATDEDGLIYVVDRNGSGLALVGPDGSFLGRKVGSGWTDGLLYYPGQICVSDEGTILIADRSNSRVQLFKVFGAK